MEKRSRRTERKEESRLAGHRTRVVSYKIAFSLTTQIKEHPYTTNKKTEQR